MGTIYSDKTASIFKNYEAQVAKPLDSRSVVQNISDLYNTKTFKDLVYQGMLVSVIEDGNVYQLIGRKEDTTNVGTKIYLQFDQDILTNNKDLWVKIGSDVDLSNYYTKEQVDDIIVIPINKYSDLYNLNQYNKRLLYIKEDLYDSNELKYRAGLYYVIDNELKDIASKAQLNTIKDQLNTLIGEDSDKSVRTIATEVLSDLVGDSGSLGNLAEILDWFNNEEGGVVALMTKIEEIESSIQGMDYDNGTSADSVYVAKVTQKDGKISTVTKSISEIQNSTTQDIKVIGVTVGTLKDGDTIASGSSMEDVLKRMLCKEIDVTATKPSGVLKFGDVNATNKTVEMGSTFATILGNTFTDGKFTGDSGYSYTLPAGCTQTSVVFYDGSDVVNANYSKVIKSTTKLKATVSYSANANTPKKNTGDNSDVTIPAGSFTAQLSNNQPVTITPTYYAFYKTFASGAAENTPVSSTQNNGYTTSFSNPETFNIPNSNSIAKVVIYTRSTIKDVQYVTPVMGQTWIPQVTLAQVIKLPNGEDQKDYKKYVIKTADDTNFAGGSGCYISIEYQ